MNNDARLSRFLLVPALACAAAAAFAVVASVPLRPATASDAPALHRVRIAVSTDLAARVGASIAPGRLQDLANLLRTPEGASVLERLEPSRAATGTWTVEGVELDLVTLEHPPLRCTKASLSVTPSADGRAAEFAAMGSCLGGAVEAKGRVEWSAGPLGGDRLGGTLRVSAASVEALRAWLPQRIDETFAGELELETTFSGVIGETTSEDSPATPLEGDAVATLDWELLGRRAPLRVAGGWFLDDRSARIRKGRMEWLGLGLDVQGWFDPKPSGRMSIVGRFVDVDTSAVAADWGVREAWRPEARLSGKVELHGEAGKGMLRYDAKAPSVLLPALGGWTVRLDAPRFEGTLAAINAEVMASVFAKSVRVADIDLGDVPIGVQWWRRKLSVTIANSRLWGAETVATLVWSPDTHPEWSLGGRLLNGPSHEIASRLLPWLGLDVAGTGSVAFRLGQDASRTPFFGAEATLGAGRFSSTDLLRGVLDALGAVDADLARAASSISLPAPREGRGTRADRLFFQVQAGEGGAGAKVQDLGGVFLRAEDLQLDADGTWSRRDGLAVAGTLALPARVAEPLVAAAPWLAALRVPGAELFVPVAIAGLPSAPVVSLAPGFADTLASAKEGRPVEAARRASVRRLPLADYATLPGDPANQEPR